MSLTSDSPRNRNDRRTSQQQTATNKKVDISQDSRSAVQEQSQQFINSVVSPEVKQKRLKKDNKFAQSLHEANQQRFEKTLADSNFLANSSINRKVSYNVDLNFLRKKILSNLQVDLNLIFLSAYCVKSLDVSDEIDFDLKKEGYLLGEAVLKFRLQETPEDRSFFLDYCGDKIYSMIINGIEHGIDTIEWRNNQILMRGLRAGTRFYQKAKTESP